MINYRFRHILHFISVIILFVVFFNNLQKKGVCFLVKNKVIDFNALRNPKKLGVREIGSINITVYSENTTQYPVYGIVPNRKELEPIVDLLDRTLTNNGFKFSEELKVHRL